LKNNKLEEVSTKSIKSDTDLKCEKLGDCVKFTEKNLGKQFIFPLSRLQELLLKNSKEPGSFYFRIGGMEFKDVDNDGVYELVIKKTLFTRSHYPFYTLYSCGCFPVNYDSVADITITYKYVDLEWKPISIS